MYKRQGIASANSAKRTFSTQIAGIEPVAPSNTPFGNYWNQTSPTGWVNPYTKLPCIPVTPQITTQPLGVLKNTKFLASVYQLVAIGTPSEKPFTVEDIPKITPPTNPNSPSTAGQSVDSNGLPCVKQVGIVETYNSTGTVSAGAKKINDEALAMLGQTTCKVNFTGGGKLACAYVVNSIINNALGKPLRGETNETDTFGRSTIDMKNDLDKSNIFYLVGTSVGTLLSGDIIISPTTGGNTGHVGIYTSTGKIVSNSSSRTSVDDHFTPTSWLSYYNDRKGLVTYIYRLRQ